MGFQASGLADAVRVIGKAKKEKCTIFLAFTANLVASGLRGVIAELCERGFVDAVITTAGSIDHDVIKASGEYELGVFGADDEQLHRDGINRLGNIFIRTSHFERFEKEIRKVLASAYKEKKVLSPRELNAKIGASLKDGHSFLAQCSRKNIPVFCPGIVDGAIGLQSYFFRQDNKDFGIDVTADMQELADLVIGSRKTAAIILGGGIAKHFTIGSNLLRDGMDYAAYFTTAQEYDGSLSGAFPKEAKSWGKIRENAKTAVVYGDATINFSLAMAALKEKGLL